MILRSFRNLCLALFALCVSLSAVAVEKEPFTKERFDALQAEGAVVLIDVFAPWCPDCKKQQEALAEFDSEHPAAPLHILTVDFDNQKEWVTHFKAPRQSTLILYKGSEQVWLSVAETRKDMIFAALNAAL